jgi:hypothetical protein
MLHLILKSIYKCDKGLTANANQCKWFLKYLTFSRQLFANAGLELSYDFSHCQPMLKTITDKNVQSRGVHAVSNSEVRPNKTRLMPAIFLWSLPLRKEHN